MIQGKMTDNPRILQRPRFTCECGSILSSAPYAKKRHFSTTKHQVWVEESKDEKRQHIEECPICYEEKITEVTACATCRNEICFDCYGELIRKICPYCRGDMVQHAVSYEYRDGIWTKKVTQRRPRSANISPHPSTLSIERQRHEKMIGDMYTLLHKSPSEFIASLERLKANRSVYLEVMKRVFSDSVVLSVMDSHETLRF